MYNSFFHTFIWIYFIICLCIRFSVNIYTGSNFQQFQRKETKIYGTLGYQTLCLILYLWWALLHNFPRFREEETNDLKINEIFSVLLLNGKAKVWISYLNDWKLCLFYCFCCLYICVSKKKHKILRIMMTVTLPWYEILFFFPFY